MVAAAVVLRLFPVAAEPQVPCLFIFGDSVIDNGNNNNKPSIAKSNFLPYGIDFPQGPTGRFSNGETVADVISDLLGFDDYLPSFESVRGPNILRGVNYASAGAGILPETGRFWGEVIYFGGQVSNFNNTATEIVEILGDRRAAENHLEKCIYFVALGNNDFLNYYILPQFFTTGHPYSIPQYINLLIQEYYDQIRVLYGYGGRKFALVGASPVGCIPLVLSWTINRDGSTCHERYNGASKLFNQRLRALVDDLNIEFPATQFIYVDGYNPILDVINNASAYGFKVTNEACCGRGRKKATVVCLPEMAPCENRDEYVFWDFAHPSQAANKIMGTRAYTAPNPSDAYPFGIRRLAQLTLSTK